MDQNKERNSFVNSTAEKDERLEKLKQLYPELFSDGKLNIDVLKEITGGTNPQEERTPGYYGLYWPGKQKAKIEAKVAPKGTLVPVHGDGVNEDTTHNIYIEGDNLEVLRILKKSYKGRVKVIYIDPPYNTGNDFVYQDNYKIPVEEYLKLTGQIDEQGSKLTTNQKSNGAFHTNWLNMMMPRLMLARDLLTDDGVIFISIDDNEVDNLKKICDEIFGEENFIAQVIWKNKFGSGAQTTGFIGVHEYILVYSKEELINITRTLTDEERNTYNKTKDEKFERRGGFVTQPLSVTTFDDRPSLRYPINYNGYEIWPEKQWVWSKERMQKAIENNEVVFNKQKDGSYKVRSKKYLIDEDGNERRGKPTTFYTDAYTQDGTKDIRLLFNKLIFDYTKPVKLIKYLIELEINNDRNKNFIVLDFFSGSATTAQAVMQLNAEDGGNRKFIMVQLPEPCDEKSEAYKAGYKNICEIGKERIRRAAKKIKEETGKDIDYGFKVFRMQKTNFTSFTPVTGQDDKAEGLLFKELEKNAMPLIDGWKKENVLNEIILKQGFSLDCNCKKVESFTKNTVYCIKDSDGPGSRTTTMYVCLDDEIKPETIASLKLNEQEKFVCLDNAIDDTNYARLSDKGRIETI